METDLSVDTMHNRPILNTRDEPHADRRKYRRLHLIVGDANMCEYATALKVGTTALVLELIEKGAAPDLELDHPVSAVKQISRDPELKATVRLRNGRAMSGLEIQERYYTEANRILAGQDAESDWILEEWAKTLDRLSRQRGALVGKLDWVTKEWLLETFMREERVDWSDPWLASLDLEYHNINPEQGLYLGLEAEGKAWRMTTDADIEQALLNGPADTRGGLRGLCVRRFAGQIKSVQWERVHFTGGLRRRVLEMEDLFEPGDVLACMEMFERAASPAEALDAWAKKRGVHT
jgi:proteasome accessory factor A